MVLNKMKYFHGINLWKSNDKAKSANQNIQFGDCEHSSWYNAWDSVIISWLVFMALKTRLTLQAPNPQNGQTVSNNSSACANELFECVGTFCGVGT